MLTLIARCSRSDTFWRCALMVGFCLTVVSVFAYSTFDISRAQEPDLPAKAENVGESFPEQVLSSPLTRLLIEARPSVSESNQEALDVEESKLLSENSPIIKPMVSLFDLPPEDLEKLLPAEFQVKDELARWPGKLSTDQLTVEMNSQESNAQSKLIGFGIVDQCQLDSENPEEFVEREQQSRKWNDEADYRLAQRRAILQKEAEQIKADRKLAERKEAERKAAERKEAEKNNLALRNREAFQAEKKKRLEAQQEERERNRKEFARQQARQEQKAQEERQRRDRESRQQAREASRQREEVQRARAERERAERQRLSDQQRRIEAQQAERQRRFKEFERAKAERERREAQERARQKRENNR